MTTPQFPPPSPPHPRLPLARPGAQAQKRGHKGAAEDMDSAALLNSLASLYMDMDRPREALPLYKRALVAVEACLSPQDPEIAIYLANLAGVLQVRHCSSGRKAVNSKFWTGGVAPRSGAPQ